MKWRTRKQSTNVDDRRSRTGRAGPGLPSIGTILFLWPMIKKLLRSKGGRTVLFIGAIVYLGYLFVPTSLLDGGSTSSSLNEEIDDDHNIGNILRRSMGRGGKRSITVVSGFLASWLVTTGLTTQG